MLETPNLEMIPPVLGRETTMAWYPPAYSQYTKVPYKTLAVLDDLKYFNSLMKLDPKSKPRTTEAAEINDSILSSKMNSIRQGLTKSKVLPLQLPRQSPPKPQCFQEYMKVPVTWRPRIPKADIGILMRDTKSDVGREMSIADFENNAKLDAFTRPLTPKPWTAPGQPIETKQPYHSPTTSSKDRGQTSTTRSRKVGFLESEQKTIAASEISPSSQYANDLEKYKWLMEIPGDPFFIKKPHLPKPLQFFESFPEVKILSLEPRMAKENRSTMFYNALQYQPMSFDISPSFKSERFNKIKNQLRSQGKWNYSSKNFSFVY